MSRVTRIENFARVGYVARGVVYLTLGYLALSSANPDSTADVLQHIKSVPLGVPLLWLTALGLVAYAFYRVYGAIIDLYDHGTDVMGLAKRAGGVFSGGAHLVLAWAAASLAMGSSDGDTGTGLASAVPDVVLTIVGVGFMVTALDQLRKAFTAKFMKHVAPDAPAFVSPVGRAGYLARFVVFAIIGWQMFAASIDAGGDANPGISKALATLGDDPLLYVPVAAGLALFGIFSLLKGWYAQITDEDILDRLKS